MTKKRSKSSSTLDVYHRRDLVGKLHRSKGGEISFQYSMEWVTGQGFAISESLLIQEDTYKGEVVRNFFENLIPENDVIKESIAAKFKAKSTEAFDLLERIGIDCIGALMLVPEGTEISDPDEINYRVLTDKDIEEKLKQLSSNSPLGMEGDDFRISLAGMQEKTAFLWTSKGWAEPIGVTPTTHIFKPAMKTVYNSFDLLDSVDNEWTCLYLLKKLGINVCDADIEMFGDQKVLVVRRFDRFYDDPSKFVGRIHQEDMCQAMGYPSHMKYQSYGGPSAEDIAQILKSSNEAFDKVSFIYALIAFDLLCAIDGHAKNFSIYRTFEGKFLTPIYDVLSAYPLIKKDKSFKGKMKMAMKFGNSGHYRHSKVRFHHYIEDHKKLGMPKEALIGIGVITYSAFRDLEINEEELPKHLNKDTFYTIVDGLKKRLEVFFNKEEMELFLKKYSD